MRAALDPKVYDETLFDALVDARARYGDKEILEDQDRHPLTYTGLIRAAFVLGRNAYLLATWQPDKRPDMLEPEQGVQWLGLEVKDHQLIDPGHAEVECVARWRVNGRAERMHERSRFVRLEDGEMSRWIYVDGEQL